MSSNLWVKNGVYDPTKRFAFTNITEEVFTFKWDGRPITVPAGATVELPHHLAILATTDLVDKIMQGIANDDETAQRKKTGNMYYRSPKGAMLGVPAAREVWETKILVELEPNMESPQIALIKAQLVEELKKDLTQQPAARVSKMSVSPAEFAEIGGK